MNVTPAVFLWLVGSLVGMGLNGYMIRLSYRRRRRLALSSAEEKITWYDTVQWGFGWAVKLIGFAMAVWVIALPPPLHPPTNAYQRWAVLHGRVILEVGLLVMMYLMDIRDGILVYFNKRWWRATTGGKT